MDIKHISQDRFKITIVKINEHILIFNVWKYNINTELLCFSNENRKTQKLPGIQLRHSCSFLPVVYFINFQVTAVRRTALSRRLGLELELIFYFN